MHCVHHPNGAFYLCVGHDVKDHLIYWWSGVSPHLHKEIATVQSSILRNDLEMWIPLNYRVVR